MAVVLLERGSGRAVLILLLLLDELRQSVVLENTGLAAPSSARLASGSGGRTVRRAPLPRLSVGLRSASGLAAPPPLVENMLIPIP